MNDRQAGDETLRQYLLGALAEEERARIEAEALRDDGRYEDLLALEDDLFHDYARGGLSDVERGQFEARFLATPEGRERLEAARALLQRLGPAKSRPLTPRNARWLAAAAALLIAAATAWLGWRASRERVREAGVPPAAPSAAPTPVAPSAAPVRVIALALSPGLVRGGGQAQRATLPASEEATLRLTLTLPARARGPFAAVLASPDGIAMWSGPAGPPEGGRVTVEIPGRSLPEGDYELVLSGQDSVEVASYTFRLLRE